MVVRLRIIFLAVRVAVMVILIMRVLVSMSDSIMDMGMLMAFPVKAQDAGEHQRCGEPEECGRVLMKQNQCGQNPDEWTYSKIGAAAGRTDLAQCAYEQHQAGAVAERSDQKSAGDLVSLNCPEAENGGKYDVEQPGRVSLDGGQDCCRQFIHIAGQVVVDAPEYAGQYYQYPRG